VLRLSHSAPPMKKASENRRPFYSLSFLIVVKVVVKRWNCKPDLPFTSSILGVVGKPGLEPGRLSAHDPKSSFLCTPKYLNVFPAAKKVLASIILYALVPLSSFLLWSKLWSTLAL